MFSLFFLLDYELESLQLSRHIHVQNISTPITFDIVAFLLFSVSILLCISLSVVVQVT